MRDAGGLCLGLSHEMRQRHVLVFAFLIFFVCSRVRRVYSGSVVEPFLFSVSSIHQTQKVVLCARSTIRDIDDVFLPARTTSWQVALHQFNNVLCYLNTLLPDLLLSYSRSRSSALYIFHSDTPAASTVVVQSNQSSDFHRRSTCNMHAR